jgi:Transposase domain (DUF772)
VQTKRVTRSVPGRDERGGPVADADGPDRAALSHAGRARAAPMPLERMLRIYLIQQCFNLSDPGAEDVLYDSETMR